jgi:hypothetical protein
MLSNLFKTYGLLILAFATCCCNPYVACAQTEEWDNYLATVDGKAASVLVDMGLFNTAPDKRYPYVVITGPQTQIPGKKGIPNKQEIADLEQILDVTTNFITGVTAKVLAGTFTYNNQRLNYYYVKDTVGVRNAILRVYNRNFKGYNFVIRMKYDPQWLNYITFLYPSEETRGVMENNKIITRLLESGDSLTTKRNINFAACFTSDSARASFTSYVQEKGYSLQKTVAVKNTPFPLCTIFYQYNRINIDSINIFSADIKREVKKHGGQYNGWDATIK